MYVLGQVTDVSAEQALVPLLQLGAIQAHLAGCRCGDADQQACQGRLAGAGRTNDAKAVAGRQLEAKVDQARLARARLYRTQLLHQQVPERRRQWHAGRARRLLAEQGVQPLIGLACRTPLTPHGNQLVDRRQHPGHENGAGDHHPRGNQLLDRQPCAQAQYQRLQGQAQALGHCADRCRAFAAEVLAQEKTVVQPGPALTHRRQHAHRLHDFGITQVGASLLSGLLRQLPGFGERRLGQALVDPGEDRQQHGANQRHQPQPGAEQEHHQQVHREPRRIEKGKQRLASSELAQAGQVAQYLVRRALVAGQAGLVSGLEHPWVEAHVHLRAEADHHQAAHPFQQAHEGEQAEDHQAEHQQGHLVARRQHPVIDLQHVQRRRQHQQVDHRSEQANVGKAGAAGLERLQHLVRRAGAGCFHEGPQQGKPTGD
ncbi:hypothetical protein D3C80_955220 [compost metagenome]